MFNLLRLGSIWGKIGAIFKFKKNITITENKTVQSNNNNDITNNNITNNNIFLNFTGEIIQKISDKNFEKLISSLQNILKENLVPLEPYKSDTAIQKLHYVTEENIAEMFIELLTKSADSRYSNKVHARYQTIVSSLDPDDAKLLKFISGCRYFIEIKQEEVKDYIEDTKYFIKEDDDEKIFFPISGIPFLEIRSKNEMHAKKYRLLQKIFTYVEKLPTNKNIQETESQMEHLASLGLIEIRSDIQFPPIKVYDHLENSAYVTELIENANKRNEDIQKIKGRIDLTTLGKNFLSIVLKDKKEEKEKE